MRIRFTILILLACMTGVVANAQSRKYIKEGNKLYEAKKYKEAGNAYTEALKKEPNNTTGMFNLGNSLYQQKQYESARKMMDATAKNIKPKEGKAAVNYNVGNSYMAEQKWEDAIDAYKKALRNNPQDADAKYNLSYANQMLKKQQHNSGGKNDKKDNKDQKKDDKNKDDKQNQDKNKQDNKDKNDKDNKDQQQDQNKDGDKEDKQDQRPQSQPSKLSEKQAEQLLNALQQEEKKLQGKLQKGKGTPVKVEKDW